MNRNEIRSPRKKKEEISKRYLVNEEEELLSFLLRNIKGQSRNNIKNLLSKKCILVDGVCITQFNYLLHKKQTVMISKVPLINTNPKNRNEAGNRLDIIFEDDELIVINKPYNLLSVMSDKESKETAYSYVNAYLKSKDKKNNAYIVHRIDKQTSGVLMFVKNPKLIDLFQDNWNDLVSVREYIAIVEGTFKEKEGTIKSYLTTNSTNLMFSTNNKKEGKLSITNYSVIKESKKYSMLKVLIDSGRKNQIRVHMHESNHTVIGDDKYGEPSNPINRLGLHAHILEIKHPITNKVYKFIAPIPSEFNKLF